MKDKEAREQIEELRKQIEALEELMTVRDCPKCKHDTPQIKHYTDYWWNLLRIPRYDWLCLVCGSKLVCTTATTCKVVKEKHGK